MNAEPGQQLPQATMPPIERHALVVLEYDAVRDLLAAHARTAFGRRALAAMRPSADPTRIAALQAETTELRTMLDTGLAPSLGGVEDIADIVTNLPDLRAPLEPDDLVRAAATLDCATNLKQFFAEHDDLAPRMARVVDAIADFTAWVGSVQRCIDNDRSVRDTASPQLEKLRRSLRALRHQIERKLRALIDSAELQGAIDQRTVTSRSGRPVIAVKANYRRAVQGTLLDKSNTGATVYIEPHAVTDLANEFEDVRFEEAREVTRILWELTRGLSDRTNEVMAILDALAYVDLTLAKARYSRQYAMHAPAIGDALALQLVDARHPLLLHYAAVELNCPHAEHVPDEVFGRVVPMQLRLGDDFDQLVVTGPNTGGKTVALKTVGLLALMMQSGMHVPAAAGTMLPVYQAVCADIGDEQSIAQSLSTFSSHMRNIVRIVDNADSRTLVLLDELGSGTDPAEGAALATAILDCLRARRAHVVATTHLGALKTYAYSTPRVENGSMEFDTASLQPTFRLLLGQPGSSNALAIAQRLGMPATVLDQTRHLLGSEVTRTEELINKVQETRAAAEQARAEVEELKADLAERLDALDAERRAIQDQAQRFVACTLDDVRSLVVEFAAAARNAPAPWSDKAAELRRRADEIIAGTPLADQHARFVESIKEGDQVYVSSLQAYGTVRMIRRRRRLVRIAIDGLLYDVPFGQVTERPFALKDPRPSRREAQRPQPAQSAPADEPERLPPKAHARFLSRLESGDRVYVPALQGTGTVRRISADRGTLTVAVGMLDVELAADQVRPCRRRRPRAPDGTSEPPQDE